MLLMQPKGLFVVSDAEYLDAICRQTLSAFVHKAFTILEPSAEYEHNWHIDCIAEHLQAVWDSEIRLLVINMPPRSLKTHITSVSFPSWGLGKSPTTQFMLTSFKASLAEKMTRKSRLLLQSAWYQRCFPETKLSEELSRQYYFETTQRGQYFSSSMSNVTGEGCDIQVCDDPLSPDEALSDTVRVSTNETIRGTLFSRFNDPRSGRFVLNMQRLHEDDPTGNLLADQGWYHLKLPARAMAKSYHYSMRGKQWDLEKGEYLFPARFSEAVLSAARTRLGEYNYAGQYLQEPVPIGGGLIKMEWMKYYPQGGISPRQMNIAILVDPAGGDEDEKGKKDKNSDWTVLAVVGAAPDNNYYLLDMVRDRLNPTERIDTLFMLHRKWNKLAGKPPRVGYEKYSMQSDTFYVTKKQADESYHFPLMVLGGPKSKTTRVSRLVPDMQNGRWWLPRGLLYIDGEGKQWDLIQELLNVEIKTFPMSKFDDMLDALSRVYEPDLGLVFPAIQEDTVSKSINSSAGSSSDDWADW